MQYTLPFLPGLIIGISVGLVYASFFEWTLHKYFMHRPFGAFRYPYQSHALTHHKIFKADETYHLIEEKDKYTIPMAWWNGPVLVIMGSIPFLITSYLLNSWGILAGVAAIFATYYGVYEYMHWCMHLPKKRRLESSSLFIKLNGHHLLHHRYMNKNFNVVMPLADLCLGTLLPRSPLKFKQAVSPALPDVQPKVAVELAPEISSLKNTASCIEDNVEVMEVAKES